MTHCRGEPRPGDARGAQDQNDARGPAAQNDRGAVGGRAGLPGLGRAGELLPAVDVVRLISDVCLMITYAYAIIFCQVHLHQVPLPRQHCAAIRAGGRVHRAWLQRLVLEHHHLRLRPQRPLQ